MAGIVTATGFSGPATGLTDVNAATVGGMTASSFWQLNGNVGTTPGTHFVGTVDNQPVEIKVNGARALRLEPTTSSLHGPNVIAGSRYNTVTPGTYGATIAGGGGAHLQFFLRTRFLETLAPSAGDLGIRRPQAAPSRGAAGTRPQAAPLSAAASTITPADPRR